MELPVPGHRLAQPWTWRDLWRESAGGRALLYKGNCQTPSGLALPVTYAMLVSNVAQAGSTGCGPMLSPSDPSSLPQAAPPGPQHQCPALESLGLALE